MLCPKFSQSVRRSSHDGEEENEEENDEEEEEDEEKEDPAEAEEDQDLGVSSQSWQNMAQLIFNQSA
ncbi:hypothetical protein PoB_001469700 [Plakobranchus ocellatus]|uniref:Uncharacterized protein n=1 Tax=Plakobranchus ocellatus TaxID=259542 RepID=A0AAV3Z128_9GAST|nr:hypothetical protein PoB_001469700 [Plakobranchus ocellatus]